MRGELRAVEIMSGAARLASASWLWVLGWLAAMVACGAAIDTLGIDPRADMFCSQLSVFAQFLLTSRLLLQARRHHARGMPGRAASFVGAGIVTGILILLATLLLVVPGLYLAARWALVCPLIIGDGMTMGDAMRESWRRTAGNISTLMAALAILFVPGFGGSIVFVALVYPEYGPAALAPAVAANLLLFGALVANWCLAVAAHLALSPDEGGRVEIRVGQPAAA